MNHLKKKKTETEDLSKLILQQGKCKYIQKANEIANSAFQSQKVCRESL